MFREFDFLSAVCTNDIVLHITPSTKLDDSMRASNSGLPRLYIRNLAVPLLYLPSLSAAAPIRDSSTSSSWLACLTALLIFSAICLSAFKFLFVRHRKASNLKGPPPSLVRGQYIHRSLKFFKHPAYTTCKSSKSCKAGFLIGLFGSPSFEIRSKPSEITLIYPGADTSGSSQRREFSSDTSTTYKTKSSAFSTGPVVLLSEKNHWHPLRQTKQTPLSLSLTKSTRSHFLLPTQLSFDLGRIRRKKKPMYDHISSPQESFPWPHNHLEHATLRLVKLYADPGPGASLPLCNVFDGAPGLPPPAPPLHSFAVAHLNRSYPLPIAPLPSLPNNTADSDQGSNEVLPPSLAIDHPYNNVLLNLVKPGRQNSRRASLSPNLSVIEEVCHGTVADLLSAPMERQLPAENVIEQCEPPFASEMAKGPPVTFSAYDTLKRKEKLRPLSLRNRRSPPLGPSPLRSMILPDLPENDAPQSKDTTIDEIEDNPAPRRRSIQYQQIGLGLPSIFSPPIKGNIDAQTRAQDHNDNSSEGRESVLEFLRELAEETKDWDESIVLDEGFKNMIQRSQAIFSCTSLENVTVKCSTPKAPPSSCERNKTPPRLVSFWIENSVSL